MRGYPTGFILYAVKTPIGDDMAELLMRFLITAMLTVKSGLVALDEEEGFACLRPVLGLPPKQASEPGREGAGPRRGIRCLHPWMLARRGGCWMGDGYP